MAGRGIVAREREAEVDRVAFLVLRDVPGRVGAVTAPALVLLCRDATGRCEVSRGPRPVGHRR